MPVSDSISINICRSYMAILLASITAPKMCSSATCNTLVMVFALAAHLFWVEFAELFVSDGKS
jgi:hypothetical protein